MIHTRILSASVVEYTSAESMYAFNRMVEQTREVIIYVVIGIRTQNSLIDMSVLLGKSARFAYSQGLVHLCVSVCLLTSAAHVTP